MNRQGSLLIVDDYEPNRDALSRRLAHHGYAVQMAPGGAVALSMALDGAFDLVLLDVEMPGMSGLEVLQRLRETWSQTELPVIMVTARTQGEDIVEAFRLGANDYVTKPIDFPVALARVRTHLSHKWAVEDLHESEERYALAVRGANDGLWDWNLVTNEVYWSPRWKAMLGYADAEIGTGPDQWLARVHPEDQARVSASLEAHLSGGGGHYESEHRMLHRDGTYRWVRCRGAAVTDGTGAATRLAGSLTDITDAKLADRLTGLPNRLQFGDLVDRAIHRAQRRQDCAFALLALGLDRFKAVNNSLGRPTADRLLGAVARRLESALAEAAAGNGGRNELTLARLGGDEFGVLIEEIADPSDAVRLAERLRLALREPFDIDGYPVFTSAAVGVTHSVTGYRRSEEALQDAVIALHRAKADGGPRCELFDPAMRARAVSRMQVETDLRLAVDRREFTVLYQPIVSTETGHISAFEALARWQHPSRGLLTPDAFIAIAEDTGSIREIGRLVLAAACGQLAAWVVRFGALAPQMICVNVSSRQLAHAGFVAEVGRILRDTDLDASRLKLEITETSFIDDIDAAADTLARLRALGVALSIDDFGTGYSSLSYLHRLHADTLKVDRSFVSRIAGADTSAEMVRAIVSLARGLDMDVVAEGVETAAQLGRVKALGCEQAQGFLFSVPVGVAAAEAMIAAQPWRYTRAAHALA